MEKKHVTGTVYFINFFCIHICKCNTIPYWNAYPHKLVLSSDIDVIREVSDGAALLVNPKDIKENIEGVYKVLDNSNYYRNKGFERAEYYSRDAIRNKLVSYYHSIK